MIFSAIEIGVKKVFWSDKFYVKSLQVKVARFSKMTWMF